MFGATFLVYKLKDYDEWTSKKICEVKNLNPILSTQILNNY